MPIDETWSRNLRRETREAPEIRFSNIHANEIGTWNKRGMPRVGQVMRLQTCN